MDAFPPRLNTVEASRYLKQRHGISRTPGTLAWLRSHGGGPSYRLMGRNPLYDIPDLDEWAEQKLSAHRVSSSAELSGAA